MKHKLILFVSGLFICSCSGFNSNNQLNTDTSASRGHLIYSNDLSNAITAFIPSVVEVFCLMEYDVEHYFYNLSSGKHIADESSPTHYQLKSENGIFYDKKNFRAYGGGMIIGATDTEYLILTSRHIVNHADTLINYIKEEGKNTDVPRMRAFLKRIRFAARGQRLSVVKTARVLAGDARADLALISVNRRGNIGKVFKGGVIQNMENVWGSLAVIAGYPSEILQVAMGLTSAAPYPGNFSLDINGTFGYSGGPVFLFDATGGLSFAGIGRSIPGKRVFHVAPDSTLQFATKLLPADIGRLQVEEVPVFGAARMYAVDMRFITRFLTEAMPDLRKKGFVLSKGFENLLD
ncbi:MAG: serine protease [Calditrichaeota bacterium]|nr:MAG: serine protease [Calditrichota bacterium]